MEFDFSKLTGRIKEKFKNREDFAKLIPISNNSLSKKINNKVPFTSDEIYRISEILNLTIDEIPQFFYQLKVENNSTDEN